MVNVNGKSDADVLREEYPEMADRVHRLNG